MTWKSPRHTLGWAVLQWMEDKLRFVATDEQARFIADWYSVYPHTGHFRHRRAVIEMPKGWGKSPLAGALGIAEFCGPVRFSHFDASGDPVGVPWTKPHIQVAAVSEDQAENTYGALYGMLAADEHRIARELGIDDGRTRLYLTGDAEAVLYPVTASAGSREGQRVTFAILDETHLWTKRNGGVKLANTIRRNAAKMGGRTIETTNAPVLGMGSVSEASVADAASEAGILVWANRPTEEPSPDWPDDRMRVALDEVYGDARWIDRDRIIAEIRDPATEWTDALRFYFNIRTTGAGRAVDPRTWAKGARPLEVEPRTVIGVGFDGSHNRDSTVLRACTREGHRFTLGVWERPRGDAMERWQNEHPGEEWIVPRREVKDAVAHAFATYRVGRMLCDPWKWQDEVAEWAEDHGKDIVLAFPTNSPTRMAPAVDRWLTAVREGITTTDDDPVVAQHVTNAHLQQVRLQDDPDDARTRYVLVKGEDRGQIDGAIADVLAYEAAMTMPEPPQAYAGSGATIFFDD